MAIGFTPSYTETITTEHLSQEASLVLLIEAVKQLDWKLLYASAPGFGFFSTLIVGTDS